jgi:galactose-1-phosphate uridylyltransferase
MHYSTFYNIMPDGTVKQINPFTGNEVWAVPGRASKPSQNGLLGTTEAHVSLDAIDRTAVCSFCESRYFETPPEKSRWVRHDGEWIELVELQPENYLDTVAEFRRVANMFEIVTLDYWKKNYGYRPPVHELERMELYLASPVGRKHLTDIVTYKLSFSNGAALKEITEEDIVRYAEPFFCGCHELIMARQHYRPDGTTEKDLVSSGELTSEEHSYYFRITVESLQQIMLRNRYVRYVSVFQNWLRPAGASFDHLHKQLVGLDEWGASITRQVKMLRDDPNVFNEYAANFAAMYNLVFAENEHAIAFVGIGHRFPTIEIFSKSVNTRPYEHTPEELRGVSDLVHACHAAMGPEISCNEEWYYSPVDSIEKMPWHVLIKWRINVTAGFEGGTSIFINPMTPVELRDRMVPRLYTLRDSGVIGNIRIAEECHLEPNPLKYYMR